MQTYAVKTFGCSMNYSDTERVCAVLDAQGLEEVADIKDADIAILTTCSIKQKAEDKVFSTIHNLHKNRVANKKNSKIVLTGCMVKKTSNKETEKEHKDPLLTQIEKLDAVFRIEDVIKLPDVLGITQDTEKQEFFSILPKYKSKYQAIIPIQTGCDNFCTYCIVPFTRGHEKSRPMKEILMEITALAKRGLKEVMLVGQNVNSYGKGLAESKRKFDEENLKWFEGTEKTPFTILLEEIAKIEGIERIRFQSSNPHDMTDDIIKIIGTEPKIMPALHFAVQSANDSVLRKMNRKHTWNDFKTIIEKIRKYRPDFAITTDIIVGFCGETEEAFQDTLQSIQEVDLDLIYCSQYSPRKGTPSFTLLDDDVSHKEKKARWHSMNDWLKTHVAEKMQSLIGTEQKVLIESINEEGIAEGKTEHGRTCQIQKTQHQIGDIVSVKIYDASQWTVQGKEL